MAGARERATLVGITHVVLEVGDLSEALAFYELLFAFERRGRTEEKAFLDLGDQFLVLAAVDVDDASVPGDTDGSDGGSVGAGERHVGLVVDDPDLVEERLDAVDDARVAVDGRDFRDPWGNWIQVVGYESVQFTKAEHVLDGMGLADLEKTDEALDELAEKGMAPDR